MRAWCAHKRVRAQHIITLIIITYEHIYIYIYAGIRGRARSVHMARSYTLKDLCFAPSSKLRWSNPEGEEVCRSTNQRAALPLPSLINTELGKKTSFEVKTPLISLWAIASCSFGLLKLSQRNPN